MSESSVAPCAAAPQSPALGRVTLIGAGPGDPELLTVRAAKILAQADVVLYDNLVGPGVLELLPAQAERIYVGKRAARHALPQEEITALMVRLAQQGRHVLRLKGGDSLIFGRGGEEALGLVQAGIAFEVVPGITSAQGASAYAGIPLTHRELATSVVFVTGHLRDSAEQPLAAELNWPMLARPQQTVVVYMGVSNLPTISAQLQQHGMDAHTPAAIIEKISRPEQRCIIGTIASLPELAQAHQIRPPALIVIGAVVGLQAQLLPHLRTPADHPL